jgi:hypothetical protein
MNFDEDVVNIFNSFKGRQTDLDTAQYTLRVLSRLNDDQRLQLIVLLLNGAVLNSPLWEQLGNEEI